MNLKGEMSMLNVLHLDELDVKAISVELQKKRDEMPQFFMQSPVVVDCALVGDEVASFDFAALRQALLDLSFIPVGVRNIPDSAKAALSKAGWAIMRESRKPQNADHAPSQNEAKPDDSAQQDSSSEDETTDVSVDALLEENPIPAAVATYKSMTVDKPIRSGQQVYAADSDMTVIAQTSAGSEIMADGSIHVYGPLRGRVLAGAMGNESARIYCQSLQAELVAIAGRYQLLDESDTNLIGKPAMIKLIGEKLIFEPLRS